MIRRQTTQDLGSDRSVIKSRRRNDHDQQQAQAVNDDVTLHPGDLLAAIMTPRTPDLAPLDRLAVDRGDPRCRVVASGDPDLSDQGVLDLVPGAVVPPVSEVVVDGALGGEVVGEHIPLATSPVDVEDGVEDFPHIHLPRPPGLLRGDERLDDGPLGIGQVRRVGLAHRRVPNRWCVGRTSFHRLNLGLDRVPG